MADACEMVLGNSKAIERLAKEKPGLAKRIADWLHEFFADIRKAFEGVEARHEEAKAMLDYMDELAKLWDDALVEAAENRQKGKNTETKQSQRDYSYEALISKPDMKLTTIDDTISYTKAGAIANGIKNASSLGYLNADNNPVVHVFDTEKDVAISRNSMTHGLDRRAKRQFPVIANIGDILQNSIRINELNPRHIEYENTYVLVGAAENIDGAKYIVTFVVNRITNEVNDFDVMYSENAKKESAALLPKRTVSHTTPTDSTISISDLLDYVNKYFPDILPEDVLKHYGYDSRPEGKLGESALFSRRDTEGNELSQQQQEYFKDSVVRDRNGNLLVVYHQTENDFTVFDPRRKGAGSRDTETPYGIFLKSNDKDIGLKGKKQMALYANIKNPLRVNNREDLRYRLTRLSDTYSTLIAREASLDKEYSQKYEDAQKAWSDYVSEWSKKNPGAPRTAIYDDPKYQAIDEAEDAVLDEWQAASTELAAEIKDAITSALEDNGYDGIILLEDKGSFGRSTDAYIALHPEQVKNVDNKNPTSNPDIRFSRRDSAEGLTKEEARAQAAAYTRLKAENAELRRRVEYWKGQTQRTKQATVRQTAPPMKDKAAKQGSADVISELFRKEQT